MHVPMTCQITGSVNKLTCPHQQCTDLVYCEPGIFDVISYGNTSIKTYVSAPPRPRGTWQTERRGTFCQRAFTKLLTSKISGPSSNTELNTVSAPKIGGSMTSIFEPSCITLVLIYSPWFMVVPGVCHVDIAYAALHSHRDVLPVYVLLLHECHALQPIGRKFN